MESLAGRVFAITGASKGMGLRFARALTAEGAKVALLARPSEELRQAAAAMPDALAVECNVASAESVGAAFAQVQQHFGALHGLINNAALCLAHRIDTATDDEIRSQIETNLMGPVLCIRAAVPLLRTSGGGDIINVSSETVRVPIPMLTLYGATKAALESLSAGLRVELQPDRIRVTALRSGRVQESSISKSWGGGRLQEYIDATAGHSVYEAGAVTPETMAVMLVAMLKLPREATIDLIELRGS